MVVLGAVGNLKDGIGGGARDAGLAARKGDAWEKYLNCGARLRSSLIIGCDAIFRPVVGRTDELLPKMGLNY